MSAHTPGPWVKDRFGTLRGSNGEMVCLWDSGIALGNRTPETEANGKLAGAAPELAEELKAGVDLINGDLTGVEWKRACHEFVARARAALTKAGVAP